MIYFLRTILSFLLMVIFYAVAQSQSDKTDISSIVWSGNSRISAEDIGYQYDSNMANVIICDPFYFDAHIQLQISKEGKKVEYESLVVLSRSNSSWNIEKGPFTDIFLNMYFDLYELERKKMVEKIEKGPKRKCRIKSLHKKALKNSHRSINQYLSEINLGNNIRKVAEYSKYIRAELGIDNVEMLGVGLD